MLGLDSSGRARARSGVACFALAALVAASGACGSRSGSLASSSHGAARALEIDPGASGGSVLACPLEAAPYGRVRAARAGRRHPDAGAHQDDARRARPRRPRRRRVGGSRGRGVDLDPGGTAALGVEQGSSSRAERRTRARRRDPRSTSRVSATQRPRWKRARGHAAMIARRSSPWCGTARPRSPARWAQWSISRPARARASSSAPPPTRVSA